MSLLNELRVDIGDDDGVTLSGVAPPLPPITPIGTSVGLLLRDLRVDIGDETANFGSGIFPPPVPTAFCINSTLVASASYAIQSDDALILVTPAVGGTTITLPATGTLGCIFIVKDAAGTAFSRNITIDPGPTTIDGLGLFIITQNFQSITITWNGSAWVII